jgi:hypothetical protein
MANLVLTIAYTSTPGFAQGTVVSSVLVTVTGTASGNTTPVKQNVPDDTATVTFPLTVADTYNYSVQALDGNNNPLGTAVTGSFAITGPTTISLDLPSAVTAAQA